MGGKISHNEFLKRVGRLAVRAELKAARFPADTRDKQLRRMAWAVLSPEHFNQSYLGHYFRSAPAPAHSELYRGLETSRRLLVRFPRGFAKSTVITVSYTLHQVACAPVLRSLVDGTVERDFSDLAPHLAAVRAELEAERQRARDAEMCRLVDLRATAETAESFDAVEQQLVELLASPLLPTFWDPYIQVISGTVDQAAEFTEAVKLELEENGYLRSDWGAVVDDVGVNYADFVTTTGIRVAAFGLKGSVRGGRNRQYRPTLIMVDDPEDDESVLSDSVRDRNERKIQGAVKFGLEPNGRIIVIGTPLHWDCTVCRMTDRGEYARWTKLRYACYGPDGESIWPDRWPTSALQELEAETDPDTWQAEMEDTPPRDAARVFPDTLPTYSRPEFEGRPALKVLAVDPSLGRSESSDFQAVVVLRVVDGLLLVHRVELLRLPPPDFVRAVNDVYAEERPDVAVIETISAQELFACMIVADGSARSVFPAFERIDVQTASKDIRIRSLAPLIRDRVLLLPDDGSARGLAKQFASYPRGKKDGLDALEMAIRQVREQAGWGSPGDVQHLRGRFGAWRGRMGQATRGWDDDDTTRGVW